MNYIESFLERNKEKSFVKNLIKYNELNYNGKGKVISSFLTHLLIDGESTPDNQELNDTIIEVLSLLNKYLLYKEDSLLDWIDQKIR